MAFDTSLLVLALDPLTVDAVGTRVRRELVVTADHQARVFLCWRYLTLNRWRLPHQRARKGGRDHSGGW